MLTKDELTEELELFKQDALEPLWETTPEVNDRGDMGIRCCYCVYFVLNSTGLA